MTATTLGPTFVVDGPLPVPPRYRLLDVAEIVEMDDPHWRSGVTVWSYQVDVPETWDGCGDHGTNVKPDGADVPLPVFAAFTVVQPITCTMRGIDPDDIEGWQDRAVKAFLAAESFAVEKEISQGTSLPLNPFFSDANATILNGGAATADKAALGLLADAIGATGQDGMIHATPATVTSWGELYLHRDIVGGREGLFATDGTPVVRGSGYLGAVPSGEAAPGDGEAWAFATGPMKILRGGIVGIPDTPAEALDRANNVYTFRAERDYVVLWDTALQAAILIDWTA